MFAILIAVGPGEIEAGRTVDLVESLVAYEPDAASRIVVLDDSPEDRDLESLLRPAGGDRIVVIRHLRRVGTSVDELPVTTLGPLCAGLLQALAWIAEQMPRNELRFVLKLDTDALVIAPFAKQIERLLAADPEVGLIGACRRTPNGTRRDVGHHAAIMRELHLPPVEWRRPQTIIRHLATRLGLCGPSAGVPARVSRVVARARRNGYRYGEHCLGGAYALSADFLHRLHDRGHLDDPTQWMSTQCGEDVMLSMYTHAVGLHMADAVNAGEPFGIRYIGLPYTPEQLIERRYSLIHSVKNDSNATEDDIRAFFRAHRQTRAVVETPAAVGPPAYDRSA